MILIEKERSLAKTHNEMQDSKILAKTNMRTCTKNKPIPTISTINGRKSTLDVVRQCRQVPIVLGYIYTDPDIQFHHEVNATMSG